MNILENRWISEGTGFSSQVICACDFSPQKNQLPASHQWGFRGIIPSSLPIPRRAIHDAAALSDRCGGSPVASGAVEVQDEAAAATGRWRIGVLVGRVKKILGKTWKNWGILGGFEELLENPCGNYRFESYLNHTSFEVRCPSRAPFQLWSRFLSNIIFLCWKLDTSKKGFGNHLKISLSSS